MDEAICHQSLALRTQTELPKERTHLPLDARLQIYREVVQLRSESLTYGQIISLIEEEHHVALPKGTISGWLSGKNSPDKAGHAFVPRPAPELAYVIGAKAGDASLNVKVASYQYRIRLKAIDPEFVETFSRAVAATLRCAPHRLWRPRTTREFYVEYGSYLLYRFLQRPLGELTPFIEHDVACVTAFLRGFFDSEGSIGKNGSTTASNSNVGTLEYVRYLLRTFLQIEATGPHLGTRKGSILTRHGKSYYRNVDCFWIYVKRGSLRRFYEHVGFTIQRKRIRLERLFEP